MKKFLLLFVFCCSALLFAADSPEQKSVRSIINDIYAKLREMDVRGVLKYYPDDFVSINHDGTGKSKKDLQNLAEMYDRMNAVIKKLQSISNSDDPLVIMQALYALQGRTVSQEEAENIRKLPPENKKVLITMLRNAVNTIFAEQAKAKVTLKKMFDTIKIESVNVTGDKATVFLTYTEPDSKKVRDEITFVKRNGSWLILKTVCTLVK